MFFFLTFALVLTCHVLTGSETVSVLLVLKHVADNTVFRLSHYVLFECFNCVYVLLVSKGSKDSGVVNFKLSAVLGSFRVAVCDDRSNIADIRVQGIVCPSKSAYLKIITLYYI